MKLLIWCTYGYVNMFIIQYLAMLCADHTNMIFKICAYIYIITEQMATEHLSST